MSGGATASFAYDGDALRDRVKGTVNGVTTAYIGNYYEYNVSTGVATSYYYAGSTRVAMKQGGTVYYLLSDHLGSTAVTANSTGGLYTEQRYYAFGGTRYNQGTTPTTYRYTARSTMRPSARCMTMVRECMAFNQIRETHKMPTKVNNYE